MVRIPGVKVSGTIEGVQVSGLKVLFKDDVNDITYDADVKGNTFTATLAAGCDYTAVLSGAAGYGFSVDTKNVTTTVDEALTGKTGVTLKVEEKKVYTYTGKVSSGALVQKYNLDYSSATIRNEMADLEKSGYLDKPHTSSRQSSISKRLQAICRRTIKR